MGPLLLVHSVLRFVVLFAGVAAHVICAIGLAQKKDLSKAARISCAAFVGTLHLQVLLGLATVAMGTWYPRLIGHLVMMLTAAVLAQVLVTKNRKSAKPGHLLPLIGIGAALVLIVGGVYAIGRSPFGITVTQQRVG